MWRFAALLACGFSISAFGGITPAQAYSTSSWGLVDLDATNSTANGPVSQNGGVAQHDFTAADTGTFKWVYDVVYTGNRRTNSRAIFSCSKCAGSTFGWTAKRQDGSSFSWGGRTYSNFMPGVVNAFAFYDSFRSTYFNPGDAFQITMWIDNPNPKARLSIFVQPVPVPASALMLTTALGLMGISRKLRRKSA